MKAAASVVIPTRNRRDELRRTLVGVYKQSLPLEVIVLDDASTDGTEAMVRQEFAEVIYRRIAKPVGQCALRNMGIELAGAPVVVSLDDDVVLTSEATIEQTLRDFTHDRIGAVAIPFLDGDRRVPMQHAPDDRHTWISSVFIAAAHAIRRDVFVSLGGYHWDWFGHVEELDLGLRMLAQGFVVRLGTADPLEHRPSANRSFEQMDRYGRRNLLLFTWFNVPTRYLPLHFARVTAKGALLAASTRRPMSHARGFAEGCGMMLKQRDQRQSVSPSVYRLHRLLQRRRAVPLEAIEPLLPGVESVADPGSVA
jgi:glycosyltransferase involved in cell wall biosynthesis